MRCLHRFDYFDLSIACALAVAATLCRQIGIYLPLAFGLAFFIQQRFTPKQFLEAILPAIVCVSVLLLFQRWMSHTGRMPAMYGYGTNFQRLSVTGLVLRTDIALLYLGLFCLPILLLCPRVRV